MLLEAEDDTFQAGKPIYYHDEGKTRVGIFLGWADNDWAEVQDKMNTERLLVHHSNFVAVLTHVGDGAVLQLKENV